MGRLTPHFWDRNKIAPAVLMHLPEPHHEATPARLRAKFIFHVVIGVLLIPTIICGIIRISGGAGSNVIGMVSATPHRQRVTH